MKVYCDVHSCTDSRPMYCPQCVTARKKFAADACTKCADQLIVKEHLCELCYREHNEWLSELSQPKIDDDQWYTLYESVVK